MTSVGATLLAVSLVATTLLGGSRPPKASAATTSNIVALAAQNVGKGACSTNSLGGVGFDSSCTGNGGQPEFWCADFARWVWAMEGVVGTGSLNAAAASFYAYGQAHGTLSSVPAVGDAVVFDYRPTGGYLNGPVADHMAIVSAINANGTIETISGDWGGQNGTQAVFSRTSHVVPNPAYPSAVGSTSNVMGMTISGYVAPVGATRSPTDPNQIGAFNPSLAGWARWMPAGGVTHYASYVVGRGAPAAAQDGSGYFAFNTSAAGGGVYQDVPVFAGAGQSFVGTAWLSSQSGTATGLLCLWGLTPATARNNCRSYSVPAGGYVPVSLVYDTTGPVYDLRFQVYPIVGTTDMDTAGVVPSQLQTGSFEGSYAGWQRWNPPGGVTNWVNYAVGRGAPAAAQDGSGYLAFNTNKPGGSVYQTVPVSAGAGQSFVGTAWLSSQGGSATGLLCLWGLSSSSTTNNCRGYSVPAGRYTPVQVVYDVKGPVSDLRLQVYPTAGTTDMDTASVTPSLLQTGSFERSTAGWARYLPPGGVTYWVNYAIPGAAQDGRGFLAFNTTKPGGSVYEDVPEATEAGQSFAGTAWLSSQGGTATGMLCLFGLGSSGNCRSYTVSAGRYAPVQVVYDARAFVNTLRLQVYPLTGTTEMDTASIQPSLLQTGSYEP
ncbi:MAG: CHAP domain-containing protein [Acidimicrobiaceae bacterium]|nr:CHAP domain-containing protein [Acidimicrobiaceae bacterium]